MRYFDHIDVSEIPDTHPVSVFNDVWQSLDKDGDLVPWNAVRPQEVAKAIPWLLLLEPQNDGRYYYLICGTGCEDMFGRPHKGRFFGEDMPQEAVNKRREEFDLIEAGGGPLFSSTTLPMPDKDTKEIYRGVFGFSSDGQAVDRIGVVIAPKS